MYSDLYSILVIGNNLTAICRENSFIESTDLSFVKGRVSRGGGSQIIHPKFGFKILRFLHLG